MTLAITACIICAIVVGLWIFAEVIFPNDQNHE